MAEDKPTVCPFCGWTNEGGEYEMLLHMETLHAEGESPFVVKEERTPAHIDTSEDTPYAECPVEGCGELLPLQELEYHVELHAEESSDHLQDESAPPPEPGAGKEAEFSPSSPSRSRREAGRNREPDHSSKSERQAKAISAWRQLLKMPSSSTVHGFLSKARTQDGKQDNIGSVSRSFTRGRRLGRAHLGKYAHEERMPDWLVTLLRKKGQVTAQGVIPVLAQLLEQSSSTKYAYLCHPCVQHVSKLKREGGFCGYRNIQMLSSFIIHTKSKGHEHFKGAIPSIFQIQEYIETAWDRGINAQGRVETGGIRGTRKYIGTPDALAVFASLDIPCECRAIEHKEPSKSEAQLMEYVEDYFQSGVEDPTQLIRKTNLPPLYFQHAGHSMTIIGFEKLKNGAKQLLVFDPSFHDSSSILRLVGKTFVHPMPDLALKLYRRGNRYLRAYREFELLRLRTETDGTS
ncbi:peptidase family C78-domain-containing protein [Achaetomium macrosporum]|uniref:Peptidase family C78-domain-containing protein n=1 Tax=Achaetomium macrosporum TaxID=79813 RepID=A0AAN7CFR5_9PEZI|nr:peptidase family C78-domain-containing protein [Achaetomium macrosporum]